VVQNIARVRSSDVIVSDFYDAAKAERILHTVVGINNEIHVSQDGKHSGAAWALFQKQGRIPQLHIGDDPVTDWAAPMQRGIPCELTTVATPTEKERRVEDLGFRDLAHLMRETRLATWHEEPRLRALQLFQAQCNLPFLFLASIELVRRLGNRRRILMSSRDCWLWLQLFEKMVPILHVDCEVRYFYTSRMTRYWPSENYLVYLKDALSVPAVVVDLCGFGYSLSLSLPDAENKALLLVGYDPCHVPHIIDGWLNEVTNFARHPMIADVDREVDWAIPELQAMHGTFLYGVSCLGNYDFSRDMSQSTVNVYAALLEIFSWMDDWLDPLSVLTEFRVAEAKATAELINAKGNPEGMVV
jgi:hypothetical protein